MPSNKNRKELIENRPMYIPEVVYIGENKAHEFLQEDTDSLNTKMKNEEETMQKTNIVDANTSETQEMKTLPFAHTFHRNVTPVQNIPLIKKEPGEELHSDQPKKQVRIITPLPKGTFIRNQTKTPNFPCISSVSSLAPFPNNVKVVRKIVSVKPVKPVQPTFESIAKYTKTEDLRRPNSDDILLRNQLNNEVKSETDQSIQQANIVPSSILAPTSISVRKSYIPTTSTTSTTPTAPTTLAKRVFVNVKKTANGIRILPVQTPPGEEINKFPKAPYVGTDNISLIRLILTENPSLWSDTHGNSIVIKKTRQDQFHIYNKEYYYRTDDKNVDNYFFLDVTHKATDSSEVIRRPYGIYWGNPRTSCVGLVETRGFLDIKRKDDVFRKVREDLIEHKNQQASCSAIQSTSQTINDSPEKRNIYLPSRTTTDRYGPTQNKQISETVDEETISSLSQVPAYLILKEELKKKKSRKKPSTLSTIIAKPEMEKRVETSENSELTRLSEYITTTVRTIINRFKYFEVSEGEVYFIYIGPRNKKKKSPHDINFTKCVNRKPAPGSLYVSKFVKYLFQAVYPLKKDGKDPLKIFSTESAMTSANLEALIESEYYRLFSVSNQKKKPQLEASASTKSKTEVKHKCSLCSETFKKYYQLQRHQYVVHQLSSPEDKRVTQKLIQTSASSTEIISGIPAIKKEEVDESYRFPPNFAETNQTPTPPIKEEKLDDTMLPPFTPSAETPYLQYNRNFTTITTRIVPKTSTVTSNQAYENKAITSSLFPSDPEIVIKKEIEEETSDKSSSVPLFQKPVVGDNFMYPFIQVKQEPEEILDEVTHWPDVNQILPPGKRKYGDETEETSPNPKRSDRSRKRRKKNKNNQPEVPTKKVVRKKVPIVSSGNPVVPVKLSIAQPFFSLLPQQSPQQIGNYQQMY
ncbi:hypothetical protein Bhyg_00595 [Pseudolycoriella hygida]|uniref:C2H2-type domain-containing protein n=1 Tax=Pseudolycoriella hygida TaxID=35572 RepID=A0A9Q0N854_9DIPT|nr:hypothetical protein Bhyg_00595 [Pseudolycoriella hygida]